MNGPGVYLDTSSIINRYIGEIGSQVADLVYAKAETEEQRIITSVWNLGEAVGVLDRYRSRKLLNQEEFLEALASFLAESEKMIHLGSMQVLPLALDTLIETYMLELKYHIYQADALQIATCKLSNAKLLLSADKQLLNAARGEGIETLDIEIEQDQISSRLR